MTPIAAKGEKLVASPFSSNQKELFKTAQKWVGQTFFGTILKQMHNSPFKSDLWSGGRGGEAFNTLYDQHLAERMARASGRPLANAIVKQLQRSKTEQVK
jgi:Rod binding domain-containing protein